MLEYLLLLADDLVVDADYPSRFNLLPVLPQVVLFLQCSLLSLLRPKLKHMMKIAVAVCHYRW